jgi:Uncharacterised nucleotidyltransferase
MSSLASPTAAHADHRSDSAGFSVEFRLLLACCSVGKREPSEGNLRELLEGGVHWPEVLRLAEHHSVVPLLYQALCGLSGPVPAPTLDDLRGRYSHNARRNLMFTGELVRILDCLERHSVPAIPYKGPVLAETVYGDLALRYFSDLDVLVLPSDVRRAKTALQALGYTPTSKLSDAEERAYIATGYEYTFDGPVNRNLLEIQWGILPKFYAVDFDSGALFARAVTGSVGGRTVRILSSEDLLLALCVHAAKHAWIRLCWLRDIAGAVESPPLDWNLIEQRARDLGIARILGISLLLAHGLLGADVPDSLRANWQADQQLDALYGEIARHMRTAEEYNAESLQYFRLIFRLRERVSDKFRFAFRLGFTPSRGEWAVVRLPAPLFPLYRVIRIFRLAARLLSPRTTR